jgi:hypothetical protein
MTSFPTARPGQQNKFLDFVFLLGPKGAQSVAGYLPAARRSLFSFTHAAQFAAPQNPGRKRAYMQPEQGSPRLRRNWQAWAVMSYQFLLQLSKSRRISNRIF